MSLVLYRKYRPQTFAELVGQNHIKITLQNEISSGKIAHAYLFTGPRGIGKTTTARLLAKAVNCQSVKKGEPCNKCPACEQVNTGRALDLIEIDAASNTGVDNVRENIIENARVSPSSLKYKVFIIDEVHMLSTSSFNALLKILEEPPAHAIFVLATTEIHKVPETIISRCQRFDFKKIKLEELASRLKGICQKEKVEVDDQVLENISRRAAGSSRDAESLLGQIFALGEKKITTEIASLVMPVSDLKLVADFFESLIRKDATGALSQINNLIQIGVNLQQFNKDLIEFLRELILIKVKSNGQDFLDLELDEKFKERITKLLEVVSLVELLAMIELFMEQERALKYAEIPQLPLEMAAIEICTRGDPPRQSSSEASEPRPSGDDSFKGGAGLTESLPVKKAEASKKTKPALKAQISLTSLQEKWSAVVNEIKQHNNFLYHALKESVLKEVKDGYLTLAIGIKFHYDRIRDRKNIELIEKLVGQLFGEKLLVKCFLADLSKEKESKESFPAVENLLDSVAQSFGGRVVD